MRKKSKKPVGGVFASQDWSQEKASAIRICFYKRYILRKHPQIAKHYQRHNGPRVLSL